MASRSCLNIIYLGCDSVILVQSEVLQWFGSHLKGKSLFFCVGTADSSVAPPHVMSTSRFHSWTSSLLLVPSSLWVSPQKALHLHPSIVKKKKILAFSLSSGPVSGLQRGNHMIQSPNLKVSRTCSLPGLFSGQHPEESAE